MEGYTPGPGLRFPSNLNDEGGQDRTDMHDLFMSPQQNSGHKAKQLYAEMSHSLSIENSAKRVRSLSKTSSIRMAGGVQHMQEG